MTLFRIGFCNLKYRRSTTSLYVSLRNRSTELKNRLSEKIVIEREKVKEFRKTYGSVTVSDVTIDSIYGGMRGLKTLVYETSELDPDKGIHFRGYSIPECKEVLPKAKGGNEPLPEGIFWLLLTGDIPSDEQVAAVSQEWVERAHIPNHVDIMIRNFPETLHPMSKFSAAMTALNSESQFVKAYSKGLNKVNYWEFMYEDAMNLIAKLPVIAAKIYNVINQSDQGSRIIDPKKDWSANLTQMMGFDNPLFTDFMRLYLTIHCDHEGGNVTAHTIHLVGSTLADPYLAFAAGMNGLAGPLHGLATQNALMFIKKIQKELGDKPDDRQLRDYIWKTLTEGQVVPGFGHAVLRVTDPRFICQREFALKHLPDDPLFRIVGQLFKIVPGILQETGKVKNPWPNIDAHSGVLLHYFGLTDIRFYTVLFGVSRALGTMSSLIWHRALGLPIERPRSITTEQLEKLVKSKLEGKSEKI